ncbi:hypothetical protein M3Y98_00367500 [Aphelenchoides besseyi]|nr:hypothetical protein M3Y98_00367500 [Aphelenchoides besseyi]KAI6201775.1 hypothetical protein M3Y96_00878100 [Aphelenchoides besseyi]
MSSEYLGWQERKPPREFDTSRFDRDIIAGGEVTKGYESYVKAIFKPQRPHNPEMPTEFSHLQLPAGASNLSGDPKVSAASLLRMEQHLGADALDDSNDHILFDDDMLSSLYTELGARSSTARKYSQYPVYSPKTSSEYFSLRDSRPNPLTVEGNYRGSFRSYKPREEEDWRKTDRQMLVDYKQFDSSPLSPYMYNQPYNRSQDSRIVGSNFVQLTTRPKDSFLEKIDRTLAEVRSSPRYC